MSYNIVSNYCCDRCKELNSEIKALREQLQLKNKEIQNLHEVIGMYDNEIEELEKR